MCGRFSLAAEMDFIAERFQASPGALKWAPRYNIAPTQPCLVVVEENQQRILLKMGWGLVPHWAKDKKMGFQTINARVETITNKPMFRESARKRRCLVPADGFYEWKKGSAEKIPYRVTLKEEGLFALAGLWDEWTDDKGVVSKTFTILTTHANPLLSSLHDRMPVILRREDESAWLNDFTESLLQPLPAEQMKFYEVSSEVNSWKNDSPQCIEKKKLCI